MPADNREVLSALRNMEKLIMASQSEVRDAIAALGAKIDAFIAQQSTDIQKRIDEELAKDEALDNAGLEVLKADIIAIMDRVPPTGGFDPSGNA